MAEDVKGVKTAGKVPAAAVPGRYSSVVYFHGMGSQRRYEETSRLIDRLDRFLVRLPGGDARLFLFGAPVRFGGNPHPDIMCSATPRLLGAKTFCVARNSNALLAFDTAKFQTDAANALVGTVPVGTSPVGVAVVNEGRQIIVTNSNRFANDRNARQTLTVIDASKVGDGQTAVLAYDWRPNWTQVAPLSMLR